MKYLLFAGSLRADSLNKKLIAVANRILGSNTENTVQLLDLKSLNIPVYDGDLEASGLPEGVKALGNAISDADALIIASPEYNGSIAGTLKNTTDWVSRIKPNPFSKKPVLLLGASPGYYGSIRGLNQTRIPFDNMGCNVYFQTYPLPMAGNAFDSHGHLTDAQNQSRLEHLLNSFSQYAGTFK